MRKKQEDFHQYDDIIDLPCHVSKTRPHMPVLDRAAQFSPFAALSGYADAIKEAMRLTEEKPELEEDRKAELDGKLARLWECLEERPEVTITFFQPDDKKEGGSYQTIKGRIKKMDLYDRKLILEDGTALPAEGIVQMEIL